MSPGYKKALLWAFWALNLGAVVWYWLLNSGQALAAGQLPPGIGLGRLCGLLATFCALTQLVLMGREGWLEPVFGMDRIARFHRLNGYAAFILLALHPVLLVWGYDAVTHIGIVAQYVQFGQYFPFVILAEIAAFLLCVVVGISVYAVRKRLKFEVWYYVHFTTYLAIALLPWHQLANGGDFAASEVFRWYWIGLYVFVAVNVAWWRFVLPLVRWLQFDFKVARVVPEAPRAISVYMSGRATRRFTARAGQFVLVRFLARGMWWQEHPFSLSALPDGNTLRLTIRQLGDFTGMIPALTPGTKVIISGPHGAFTHRQAVCTKTLYIAGGVGITPIYPMLQERAASDRSVDAVFMYGNRNVADTLFLDDITAFGKRLNMPVYNVLSDEPGYRGETGFIDQEKLGRLVPDITARDVFLCGPPPMMAGIITALQTLGVPKRQIHYERFALHVK